MSMKDCCSPKDANVNVNVNVDVPKIIKYLSVAGVIIVGIIFGTRCFRKMMEEGFFEFEEE